MCSLKVRNSDGMAEIMSMLQALTNREIRLSEADTKVAAPLSARLASHTDNYKVEHYKQWGTEQT